MYEQARIDINTLRGHHVLNHFMEYLKNGWFPRIERAIINHRPYVLHYSSSILVVDTIDDYCRNCRTHPSINLCKGPKLQRIDQEAAAALDIEVGHAYAHKELVEHFEQLRSRLRLPLGQRPDLQEIYGPIFTQRWW